VVNFGTAALDETLPSDGLEAANTSKPDAPVMMPAYVDLWSYTNPPPALEPDVSLFLHGAGLWPGPAGSGSLYGFGFMRGRAPRELVPQKLRGAVWAQPHRGSHSNAGRTRGCSCLESDGIRRVGRVEQFFAQCAAVGCRTSRQRQSGSEISGLSRQRHAQSR